VPAVRDGGAASDARSAAPAASHPHAGRSPGSRGGGASIVPDPSPGGL